MKLIGLLGGIGWEATATYYRMMNDCTRRELGERRSARILLHSIDAGACEADDRDRSRLDAVLSDAGRSLKAGGADFIVMASARMHQVADRISELSGLGLLHIAEPVGAEMKKDGCTTVALLDTRLAMESDVFSDRLRRNYDIAVITPDPAQRTEIDRIIVEEREHGVLRTESRAFAGEMIARLRDRGAEAVILGCTEITTIVPPDSDVIPAYDATRLHARAAVKHAIGDCHA
tara:strand:+ start:2810 stop:3508 length:699 start_codon:yes stop_codon:yes gene_type:complete